MEYSFSDRVQSLKPSAIREILKSATAPGMISLSVGNPAPEAFPAQDIGEISARIFQQRPIDALQYNVTEGYPPLRETISSYMKSHHNAGRDFDDLLITSGAQQVMDLTTKSLCNAGDVVICEAPSFIGSLNSFRSYQVRLRGVPMESDGIDLAGLERALKEEPSAKFIYTIPNFQNPSGITMSAEKRLGVYRLAKQYGVLILEDNPYGDLRFAGKEIPPIKALDEDGLVIYAGSFSKVISPGMRVGYTIAPKPIIQKMVVCKQGEDVHTNIWSQLICQEFLTKYNFDAHLDRIRGVYRKKADLLMKLVQRHLAPDITWEPIEGGLFLWCRLPDDVDMMDYCRKAMERKVCIVPGNTFLVDETQPCQSFRVNYSAPTDEQLTEGIEILGQLVREMRRKS